MGSGKDGEGVERPDAVKGCEDGGVICFFRVLIRNMSFERRERNGRGKLKDAVANRQVASRKLRVRNESPIRSTQYESK